MPLQASMKLLSVDDHLIEHPRVWEDRLPIELRERGPRIVEIPREGLPPMQSWLYEGRPYPYIGLNAVAGKKPEEYGLEPVRYDDMIPGCYDPKARLVDMDVDGVDAMLCFPSFPRFCGTSSSRAKTGNWRCCASRRGTTSRSTSGAPPTRRDSSRWQWCRCGIRR